MAATHGVSDPAKPLAVYARRVGASEERVWENVLDWEHLPWLHASSFRDIVCESAGRWGWRARVTDRRGDPFTLELRVDWDDRTYHSRTVEGPGTGTDIFTRVRPVDAGHTDVRVSFLVPNVAPERAAAVGRSFVALYTRLWDEDESMMQGRQAFLDGPGARAPGPVAEAPLGPVAQLRASLPRIVEAGGLPFRVLELDGRVLAHEAHCPHRGGPLAEGEIRDGAVVCPWHGYRFHCATGRGPKGQPVHLRFAARVEERDGEAFLRVGPDRGKAGPGRP